MPYNVLRNSPYIGVVSCREHDTLGGTAQHVRAHVANILEFYLASRMIAFFLYGAKLFHGI